MQANWGRGARPGTSCAWLSVSRLVRHANLSQLSWQLTIRLDLRATETSEPKCADRLFRPTIYVCRFPVLFPQRACYNVRVRPMPTSRPRHPATLTTRKKLIVTETTARKVWQRIGAALLRAGTEAHCLSRCLCSVVLCYFLFCVSEDKLLMIHLICDARPLG